MNTMRINEIRHVGSNKLQYSYTIEGEWSRYFEPSESMWVEYDRPIDHIPDSIAAVPLIGNVIVLASLMDADIYVDEIDRDLYECIDEFIQGYDDIMPDHVHFKRGNIVHANKIVDTPLVQTELEENLLFFSGGVDATSSLISHLEEKPALVSIWGADIPWDNEESWHQAIGFNQEVADRYGLDMLTIRSNLRKSLNNDNLENYSMNLVGDWWWPTFHYSVAMMCLAAPVACGQRARLYFASSFSSMDFEKWSTYLPPSIDNHVRFCGCHVVSDGCEFSRYDKVKRICEYYETQKIKPYLRVCYHSNSGTNCGICEKCTRTIMSILLEGADPRAYGFQYDESNFHTYFAAGIQEIARTAKYSFLSFYTDIQKALRSKYTIEQIPPVLRTFYETNLETLADFFNVPNNECLAKEKILREREAQLYQQIGGLQYEIRGSESCVRSLSEDLVRANEEIRRLNDRICNLRKEKCATEERLQKIEQSTSWRITKPLRVVGKALKSLDMLKKEASVNDCSEVQQWK